MITITASIFAALWVLALGHLAFNIYPGSAIAMARHNLFNLRDELFALAEKGELDFKSGGYKATRQLINGLIKYAHDVSLMQIFTTLMIAKARKQRVEAKDWESAINALGKEERAHVDRIYREAMMHMFRLLVTKSVILSVLFATVVLCHAVMMCSKNIFAAACAALRRPAMNNVQLGNREQVLRDVLAKPTGRKFKRFVTGEARRYTTPGFGLQLAAA